MGAALTPNFMWAQRKDVIMLTVNVPNVKPEAKYELKEDGHFVFRGEGGNVGAEREYVLDIQLCKSVKPDDTKMNRTARSVMFRIAKAEPGPYWDRLVEGKNVHMSVDWDNWQDENEDDDYAFGSNFSDTTRDLQDMDFGGGDSDDSDDPGKEAAMQALKGLDDEEAGSE